MRTWLRIASFVVAATAAQAATDTQERELRKAMAEAERGMSALEKGNVEKARESFSRSLAALPDFPDGHLGLGHVAMREKRFEDALKEFRAAEAGYASMSGLTVQLEAERYSRSRDELQSLRAKLSQLDGQMLQDKAAPAGTVARTSTDSQVERERSELQSRIKTLEEMSPPGPNATHEPPADILFFQGNALFNLKRTDEAITAWKAALGRNPKQPLVENNLAVAYWMTGRLDEAHAAMERAEALGFKVNPNFRADLEKAIAAKR